MNEKPLSDNKIIYQISLNGKTLGLISPYLFVEKLKEKILLKVPNIKVSVIYHTKGQAKEQPLVQLKCFFSKSIPDYQIKSIRENISFLAFTLEHELNNKIEKNRSSAA
jgi:hypothetical protein